MIKSKLSSYRRLLIGFLVIYLLRLLIVATMGIMPQDAYYYLIGFMVLLIAGIILIYRNVRGSTRSLGITFLVYGIIEFAGVFINRNFMPASLPMHGIPTSLHTWLAGLAKDFLAPLQMFSLIVLILGAVLLAVSFIYRPSMEEDL